MILHILNGDCALPGWQRGNFPGEVLVWKENYLYGDLPETDDPELYNRLRAAVLHQLAPEIPEEEILTELLAMHQKLFSLQAEDKLVLWLDLCPFDQALKKRLCELISAMPEVPQLFIVQQDVVWDETAFRRFGNWQDHPFRAG
jgi:hypothetical protein